MARCGVSWVGRVDGAAAAGDLDREYEESPFTDEAQETANMAVEHSWDRRAETENGISVSAAQLLRFSCWNCET